MGATGIEPMTSTVSRYLGLSILLIRLGSLWSVLVDAARYSALIVPKLFPSLGDNEAGLKSSYGFNLIERIFPYHNMHF